MGGKVHFPAKPSAPACSSPALSRTKSPASIIDPCRHRKAIASIFVTLVRESCVCSDRNIRHLIKSRQDALSSLGVTTPQLPPIASLASLLSAVHFPCDHRPQRRLSAISVTYACSDRCDDSALYELPCYLLRSVTRDEVLTRSAQ